MSCFKLMLVIQLCAVLVSGEDLDASGLFRLLNTRSHGCGSNPLLKLLEGAIKESTITEEIMDILSSRKDLLEDVEVAKMLWNYEDCIKTSDGMRYKRAKKSSKSFSEFQKKFTDLVNNV